ncbi:MAG: HlyD family efflux transporter periplasmic adaptor subunit [Acidobacteriaceae bacterium]|nr:HlyD family efflux transporter periplasmic adaptor subunit [Acidobacteriaceae bacterium]MBV9781650.1 HlyD family efflux transporter periplasmic adaptor subunit [Acidobacteriaceae bacterium]
MSETVTIATPVAPQGPVVPKPALQSPRRRFRTLVVCIVLAVIGGLAYWGFTRFKQWNARKNDQIPVAKVEKRDVSFTIVAKGDLRGANPETLIAPATGGNELHVTYLAKNGQQVKPGDVIAKFDTSEQEYKLKEANADVAEADQRIIQAKANRDAQAEEDKYALIKAKNDLLLTELEIRKNPLLPAITAKQNELALASAQERLKQVEQNLANRALTTDAGIAKEEAGKAKAASQAKTAQENIDAMTLKAKHAGYVSIKQNTNINFGYDGMQLPVIQVGDAVRPGMAIAEIPDLNNWELGAVVGEADRGHIKVGDPVAIHVIALPGHTFRGHIKDLGGTTGNFWERHFECKASLDESSPELRPGMSTEVVIATETMRGALSIPAQALFDSNGPSFVYLRSGKAFMRKDVKLIRKNETRAVISGLTEGQVVALVNPLEKPAETKNDSSAMRAAPK